jgi:hypothetical protein
MIIAIVALVILTAADLLLIRIIRKTPAVIPFLRILFFSLLLLGIGLIFWQGERISTSLQKRQWPTIIAEITKSNVVGTRAFHPVITYQFNINNNIYRNNTNLSTPGFGGKRSRHDTAETIIKEFPQGKKVKIYYNPQNPQESYMRIGPYWSDFVQFSFGLFLYSMSFFFILVRKSR